jgi:hypothetical protein
MHIKYTATSAKMESLHEMGRREMAVVKFGGVVSHTWETG